MTSFYRSSTLLAATVFTAIAFSPVFGVSLGTTSAFAQDSAAVAKVGDRSISAADLDQALVDMAQSFANFPEAERRARALDALIDLEILSQKARAAGIDESETMKRRFALMQSQALHNEYFKTKIQPSITDEAMKARFEKEVSSVKPEQEISARHILVKTEEEAKAIIAELDGGAEFVELAKTKSTGPSGPQGGDLGFFGKGRMVPEFEAAAFKLEKGAYTKEAVKTQFGYHIIKVDDKKDTALPTFDQSKAQLRQIMLTEAYAEAVKAARGELGVTVLDESLKLPPVKATETTEQK